MPRGSFRFGLAPLMARLFLAAEFLVAVNGKVFGWSGRTG
jgi:hypothetical protein